MERLGPAPASHAPLQQRSTTNVLIPADGLIDGRTGVWRREIINVLTEIRAEFVALRQGRRVDPERTLRGVGETTALCLELLARECDTHEIPWRGRGEKTYHAYAPRDGSKRFSRPVRTGAFVDGASEFARRWSAAMETLYVHRGPKSLPAESADEIDALYYTAAIGFAAALEAAGSADRGGPGAFYEMLVGATLSVLLDTVEMASISVPIPGRAGEFERVTTDISFPEVGSTSVTLVVPTKISTRERISQPYVHQAILEKADPSHEYRTVLCVGAETNMFGPQPRSIESAYAQDTLVPNTIVLYQRYIASLSGLYYLDPPHDYVTSPIQGFPQTKRFSSLLVGDLTALTSAS
jgi:hypothetical protein